MASTLSRVGVVCGVRPELRELGGQRQECGGTIRVRLVEVGGNTGGVGASVDCVRSAEDSAGVVEEHVIGRCLDTADRQGQRQQHPEVLVNLPRQFPKKVT